MRRALEDNRRRGAMADWEINEAIRCRWIGGPGMSAEPASLDLMLGEEAYLVPSKFSVLPGQTIRESLRRLPANMKRKITHTEYPIMSPSTEWSWLIFPQHNQLKLPPGFWLRSSPKSTEGRLGNSWRLIADYETDFNQVGKRTLRSAYQGEMAILNDPLMHANNWFPDLSVLQVMLFYGRDVSLNEQELEQVARKNVLSYRHGKPDIHPQIDRGLILHMDLKGENTDGIIGLRGKSNPLDYIDRHTFDTKNKKGKIKVGPFYDILSAGPTLELALEHDAPLHLLFSENYVRCPHEGVIVNRDGEEYETGLAAEMTEIAKQHGDADLHKAGFIDPGFGYGPEGSIPGLQLVMEVHARGAEGLRHGQGGGMLEYMPMRGKPERFYGQDGQNNYSKQRGPAPAKYFSMPKGGVVELSQKLIKKRRPVMTVPNNMLFANHERWSGFLEDNNETFEELIKHNYDWTVKEDAEHDFSLKQPIVYVAFYNPNEDKLFVYQRAHRDTQLSERRLHGKWSIGVGGHVERDDGDGLEAIYASRSREIGEEVNLIYPEEPTLEDKFYELGLINYDDRQVCEVHLGLLHCCVTPATITPKSSEIHQGRLMSLSEYHSTAATQGHSVEPWTEIAIPALTKFIADYKATH
jgi:dCTP deaminase